jgi:hypothetical protein
VAQVLLRVTRIAGGTKKEQPMKNLFPRTVSTRRILLALALCAAGSLLAIAGLANPLSGIDTHSKLTKAEPIWSLITSPNANAAVNGGSSGVACISETNCFAVGYYTNGGAYQTLIEQWNGSSWSVVPSPNANFTQDNRLSAVTCPSATQCFAVGTYGGSSVRTLIERWDGSSWSIVPSPNTSATQANFLNRVTCTSETNCFAVGYYYTGSVYQTLIEQWNGSSWSIVTSPNGSTLDNQLFGVACPSATQCFAVGTTQNANTGNLQTLVERWNGSSWSIISSPNAANWDRLYNVTCSSETQCFAVGFYLTNRNQVLIEQWNGSSWSIVTSPNGGTLDNFLFDVTCSSAANCFAVGRYFNGGDKTLIEQWNGSAWSVVSSPNTGNPTNGLAAVTCTSASNCVAVGSYYASIRGGVLMEQWNGSSWEIVPGGVLTTTNNELNGVTCTSVDNCFAVGEFFDGNVTGTLIQQWNGTSWSIVPSPSTGPIQYDYLNGVACSSATNCFAIGDYYQTNYVTLIEQWNGSSWSIVTSANRGSVANYLTGVACPSATNCFAVGYYSNSSAYQTLIEQWNGTSWSLVPSPNADTTRNNYLHSVTCPSATQCVAVGEYFNGSVYQTVIEQWDGTSWTIAASPNTSATQSNYLKSVACASATHCVAVGYYLSGGFRTLIEQWDGTSWSIIASPNGSSGSSFLTGVTCASPTGCLAVGSNSNQALIEQWDGTSWTIAASPSAGALRNNDLNGVACASLTSCFAAGFYLNEANNVKQTLIEEYSPAITSVAGAASRKIHGSAGTFALDLPLSGTPGIECRNAGATGVDGVDHEIVFDFANDVTSCGTSSLGTLRNGPASTQCTLDLAGIANQQSLTVTLNNVIDSENNSGAVSITMGVLLGDVNGNGFVNSSDIGQVKSLSGQSVRGSNYRSDINGDGFLNSTDIALVKSKSGTALP